MLNEADSINCFTRFRMQPNLKNREWTGYSEPRLGNNYPDGTKMSEPDHNAFTQCQPRMLPVMIRTKPPTTNTTIAKCSGRWTPLFGQPDGWDKL